MHAERERMFRDASHSGLGLKYRVPRLEDEGGRKAHQRMHLHIRTLQGPLQSLRFNIAAHVAYALLRCNRRWMPCDCHL